MRRRRKKGVENKFVHALRKAGCSHKVVQKAEDRTYGSTHIDFTEFSKKDREIFRKVIKEPKFWDAGPEYRAMRREVEAAWKVQDHGSDGLKIKNLELLAAAMRERMQSVPRNWFYEENTSYDCLVPFYFTSATYHRAYRQSDYWYPAKTVIRGSAMIRGERTTTTITFHRDDLAGHPNLETLLENEGIFLATDELNADYDKEVATYKEHSPKTGEQFIGSGKAKDADDDDDYGSRRRRMRYSSGSVSLTIDGQPTKVIMDDEIGFGDGNSTIQLAINEDGNLEHDDDELDEDENEDDGDAKASRASFHPSEWDAPKQVARYFEAHLPMHPIIRVFNLRTHEFVKTHITALKPYEYNTELINQLVLPQENKDLIDALTSGVKEKYHDIVEGKALGVIIMCSGPPGTGKTLTSEVYSEYAQRPLYMVQCSQLGTDEEDLEKTLGTVLRRATRWKAILLIDEADVYIHARGEDIHQNAIVGVFLRLLEYYQGILMLNTNRATVVDDAIVSRLTAHVKYEIPDGEDRNKLWRILSKQYQVPMSEEMVEKAVKQFPKVSGRSIRQMLRLSKFVADKMFGGRVTLKSLQFAAKFHNFSDEEMIRTEEIEDVKAFR